MATLRVNPQSEELEVQVPGTGWAKATIGIASDGTEGSSGGSAQYTAVAGSQQIVLATSVALTVPATATLALLNVETGWMRYTDDGTTPTGTVGLLIAPGTSFWAPTKTLSTIKVARDSGSAAATLNVSYYKV